MLVDGSARVACVTPVRRVAGRTVTTVEGLPDEVRRRWAQRFAAHGASQCGFCTPGIVMRLVALERRGQVNDPAAVRTALSAHLCRCTGWQTIVEAATDAGSTAGAEPVDDSPAEVATRRILASWRASLEGRTPQLVGPRQALGGAGFADDRAPAEALVALPGPGGRAVAGTATRARSSVRRPPGRRSTAPLRLPLELPPGEWAVALRTGWVEPGYLEPDASWSIPGRLPATPLANGGAFGGKADSSVTAEATQLAEENRRPVRVLWSREEVIRRGPKRPPMAAGLRDDGSGVVRVAITTGSPAGTVERWRRAFGSVLPEVRVEPVEVPGPPVSTSLRAAGWAEAQVLLAGLRARSEVPPGTGGAGPEPVVEVCTAAGARAVVRAVVADPSPSTGPGRPGQRQPREGGRDLPGISVQVRAGEPLDVTVLRSYVIGAVHQGLGWAWSEGIRVDDEGHPLDLTIRSLGILPARQMPEVTVSLEPDSAPPVPVSDAVFAAATAVAWMVDGLPPQWPTRRGGTP